VNLPSPEATAIRSDPLNHLIECNSPQVEMAMGHVRLVDWPRITYKVGSVDSVGARVAIAIDGGASDECTEERHE
jgi:hypothetical protein